MTRATASTPGALRRLGVNLLYLVPGAVGGSEIVAHNLLAAIRRVCPELELVIYCAPEAVDSLRAADWSAGARLRPAPGTSRSKPLRALLEQSWLPARARADRVDVLHSLGTTAPIICPVPSVVTVLDLIYHHVPSTFPPLARAGLELIVPRAARRADRVIAISEFGARDIVATYGLPRTAIDVVSLAPGGSRRAAATPAPRLRARLQLGNAPIVLCVSAAIAHKNLDRLIDAFAGVAAAHDAVLVLAGHRGLESERLAARAAAAGIAARVRLTGWLDDEDLEGLYRAARAFVYPSLIEGFGLPILEAMARELPVACSNATALKEVGGEAAEFFDPRDTCAMAAAITRLLDDEARRWELVARGRERVTHFSWERCATETLAVYARVLRP